MRGCRNRSMMKLKSPVKRHDSITPVQIPPQRFQPISPHENSFDDYYNGPTIEDLMTEPRHLDNFPTNPYAHPVTRSAWEYFKDYGYRIQPDFCTTFNQQTPIFVEEHLLPIGPPEPYPSQLIEDSIQGSESIDRFGSTRRTQIRDVEVLSCEDMLEMAGVAGSEDSIRAFVCGRTPQNNFIRLQPELDAVHLRLDEVQITLDIDSIIWITHRLHVLGSIKVHVLPYMNRKPPIPRDNHCSVEILWPQSDLDRSDGRRSEWFTKSVPLSKLPHIPFAQLGDGTGSFNVYIFFPRMMHQNSSTGYWATLIPTEVQNLWITDVLIPAIRQTSVVGIKEYADFSLEEWKWKAVINDKFHSSKTLTFDPLSFLELTDNIREIITGNPRQLDMFGSSFFVVDSRGIKLTTMNIRGRHPDPMETLKKEVPGLDWTYMASRKNGQLLMDLGISYHPVPRNSQHLVGLWKLNSILASYETAGMKSPDIYNTCTLAGYGGMQSTMGTIRSRSVQLTFRSTYSLLFESVRRPGQEEKFCADSEAYEATAKFKETCRQFYHIYRGSQYKSYGVREEVRGSSDAIQQAITHAVEKVTYTIQLPSR
jgi:hypothetical protein